MIQITDRGARELQVIEALNKLYYQFPETRNKEFYWNDNLKCATSKQTDNFKEG